MTSDDGPSLATPEEVAEYIASLLRELKDDAARAGLVDVAQLLDMARASAIEASGASRVARSRGVSSGASRAAAARRPR